MVVVLPGELVVGRAAELKAQLEAALAGSGPIELDGRAVGDADVAGLQVLCAAGRSARARGLLLAFLREGRSRSLEEAVALAGLGQAPEDRWLVEEVGRG
jgi:anti-anti-sigma regulatory factor